MNINKNLLNCPLCNCEVILETQVYDHWIGKSRADRVMGIIDCTCGMKFENCISKDGYDEPDKEMLENFINEWNNKAKENNLLYFKEFAEEQHLDADRFYNIIKDIAATLELEEWTTENIVKKVEEFKEDMYNQMDGG